MRVRRRWLPAELEILCRARDDGTGLNVLLDALDENTTISPKNPWPQLIQ
jgi:hypothetical protein